MLKTYFKQESERLTYRELKIEDVKEWRVFFKNNESLHFFNLKKDVDGEKEATIWIQRQIDRYTDKKYGLLGAIEKSSGKLVGMVGLIPRNYEQGDEMEIGYSFIPSSWGNGYASEAAITMKVFAKNNKVAPRVVSMINPENYASINVAKKNGMTPLFEAIFEGDLNIVYGTEYFK